jgi:hypothetical protein
MPIDLMALNRKETKGIWNMFSGVVFATDNRLLVGPRIKICIGYKLALNSRTLTSY